ncbi:aromatic amino acid lyase [Acetobacter okinawensis]|uniref:HAL/PAL/TAL family ammonia-lyase n=1 Tax=Acetobacter okinawensis TaxID=1076594 RepID=UPI001BABADB6|nr:aromatic amino acid ammonia-lyase [Acetobacter okinawensis]MBS0966827.1 aromatic amino acid lyase [Acetobacter okinawensis]
MADYSNSPSVLLVPGQTAIADIERIALAGDRVLLSTQALAAIEAGHACLLQHIAAGTTIYGVSTGLGANVDIPRQPGAAHAQQHDVLWARASGTGPAATDAQVRAMVAVRLARLALGRSGISPAVATALVDMLNNHITPVVPCVGALSEGDLAPMAHIASLLTGKGHASVAGRGRVSGAEAFAQVGLSLPVLGPKDGLALISSNSASIGLACLNLGSIRRLMRAHIAAFAMSCEGFCANLSPFQPQSVQLRPAAGQAEVSHALLGLLDGGGLQQEGSARRLQDPISFRSAASIAGAALESLRQAQRAVDLELSSSDDNPAVVAETGSIIPNGNFDPTYVAVAVDALHQALARVAAATGERVMKMMSPSVSGLPRFLAEPEGDGTGFAPVQKTVAALVAEIVHDATPLSPVVIPVAERVEDYASLLFPALCRGQRLIARMYELTAIEIMVAARAIALRPPVSLGRGTQALMDRLVPLCPRLPLEQPVADNIAFLVQAIERSDFLADFSILADNL